jgi:hypothetical protein
VNVWIAAAELLGHPYARDASVERRTVNCSVFVDHIVRRLHPAAQLAARDMMIVDRARPWSALEAMVGARVAEDLALPAPIAWHVCQGWKGLRGGHVVRGSTGHTWLWFQGSAGAAGHVLEATPRRVAWSRSADWSSTRAAYDEVRLVRLRTPSS